MFYCLIYNVQGVGSHSGTGKMQDTEFRFREILDRVARYISGYSDIPVVSSRYLQLPDLFNPRQNEQSMPLNRMISRQVSEARSLSPTTVENEPQERERMRPDEHLVSICALNDTH